MDRWLYSIDTKKNLMKAVHIIALIHSRNINYPVLIGDNKSK